MQLSIGVTLGAQQRGTPSTITVDTAPAITGTPQVGRTLARTQGSYTGVGPVNVSNGRWTRNGADIGGATGASYTLVEADAGAVIRWAEVATDNESSRAVHSSSVTVLASVLTAIGVVGTGTVGRPTVSTNVIMTPLGVTGSGQTGTPNLFITDLFATGVVGAGTVGAASVFVTDLTAVGARGTGSVGTPTISQNAIITAIGVTGTGQTGVAAFVPGAWSYSGSVVTNLPTEEGWEYTGSVINTIPAAA